MIILLYITMYTCTPTSLKNLASDELLKYAKKYSNINILAIERSIFILFPKYIQEILFDRLYFYNQIK